MSEHPSHHLRSYGRIKARTLKPRQAALIETLLPKIAVPEGPLEIATLFPAGADAMVLEIGFGAGEHLAGRAEGARTTGFIGVEPFLNGVGACLAKIDYLGLRNVRLHAGDARDVVVRLPAASLDMVYVLFPDPWPKARHHKRRLIQAAFLAELARAMKPGAELRFATDWADYAEWTLAAALKEPNLRWLAEQPDDWRAPWPGHTATRYEEKRLGDCAPIWLRFTRV